MTLIHSLSWLLLAAALAGVFLQVVSAILVHRFARMAAPARSSSRPVTLFKPLHGCDDQLYENLLSFCRQDHPCYQVVFGVRDPADPAIAVVRRLMAELPGCDIDLVVDGRVYGSNYKVSNLQNILPAAKHDVFVISDSDMRVGPDYLNQVTGPLGRSENGRLENGRSENGRSEAGQPEIGLVTCLYVGQSGSGSWSRLHASWINHGFMPSALVGDFLGVRGCFGATLALTRRMLEQVGGFAVLSNKLADDYELGAAVEKAGYKTLLVPYLIDNHVAQDDLGSLWAQEMRWARTIRSIVPAGHLGSIITHATVLAALGTLLSGFATLALCVLALAAATRLALVASIDKMLGLPQLSLAGLVQREILSFSILIVSFLGRRVAWRDRVFLVDASGRLTPEGKSLK